MILEVCKGVHCVDLGESFQTHIHLQNFASIQPRTSPVKFARSLAMQRTRRSLRAAARPPHLTESTLTRVARDVFHGGPVLATVVCCISEPGAAQALKVTPLALVAFKKDKIYILVMC